MFHNGRHSGRVWQGVPLNTRTDTHRSTLLTEDQEDTLHLFIRDLQLQYAPINRSNITTIAMEDGRG